MEHEPEEPEKKEENKKSGKEEEKRYTETSRRSTRKTTKPRYLEDYAILALHAETFVEDVPSNIEDIATRDDKENWMQAVEEEMSTFLKNDTSELTSLPPGKRPLNNRWVFKLKRDAEGNIERYKRLVIKGCAQKQGYDYEETYAPVARLTTVRTLLLVINERDLAADQMYIKYISILPTTLSAILNSCSSIGWICTKRFCG